MTAASRAEGGPQRTTGGIVLRVEGMLFWIPATTAVKVAQRPRVTRVPSAPPEMVGVALHEGVVLPVIAIGSERRDLVVCSHMGELLGLVGGEVVHAGRLEVVEDHPDMVSLHGQRARMLDVATIYARVQGASVWAGRWGG
jgi:hypothetical protein